MTDDELIALLEVKDRNALVELENKYGAYCKSIANNILRNRQDTEECLNDVYLGVWNSIPPAKPDDLKMYVAGAARNAAIGLWRKKHAGKRGSGHILNTASMAGFFPGPLMATYYATKAYVVSISEAVREELRREGSEVTVSILCPGPVSTGFGKAANVDFHFEGFSRTPQKIASYALKKLPSFYIIPGIEIKAARFLSHILPASFSAKVIYNIQNNKN